MTLVRFAPSPTGLLHVGNLRTALLNYLFAKNHGGQFMLRIDDTDTERSKPEYEEGIKRELQWMGLQWDVFAKQSERFDRYDAAKQKLIEAGRLYACYDTPEELDVKRKLLISRGLPPIYDRSALTLTDAQKRDYESQGRKPHWRFKMDATPIEWDDLIRGPVRFDGEKIADPVLFREDGVALFTLSTSVDDGELGITHILRGEDHVSNTAVQVQIMHALGHTPPVFGHAALLRMKEGKISKREGGGDVQSLREAGILPLALASYLAKIGTSDAIDLADSMQQLTQQFSTEKLGRAMANYDPAELDRLNEKLVRSLPFATVKAEISALGLTEMTEDFWNQIRPNLHRITEAKDWWEMTQKPLTPVIADNDFTTQAASLLPDGEWSEALWEPFTTRVKEATGRKGKELFMPLRLALTGREDGPSLPVMFALLGRERVKKRLLGEAA
jgi:glutamyl-tRNA synthetase